MEKEKEEKKLLRQIKELEEKLHQRLALATREARKIIEDAQEEAKSLLTEKELILEELRRSFFQEPPPLQEREEDVQRPLFAPTPLARELGNTLFQLLMQKRS